MDFRGYLSLLLLALQFGLQPMLVRTYVPEGTLKIAVVLTTEAVKIVLCSSCLLLEGLLSKEPFSNLRAIRRTWSLGSSLRCAAVPAALYSVQNMLVQLGYQYLDPLTFNLLNQTKTIFSAVCLFLVMGKRQSLLQVVALLLLAGAALVLNYEEMVASGGEAARDEKWFQLGFLPVLAASFISGLCTAFAQKVLTEARNSYLFSMELGFYGTLLLLATYLSGEGGAEVRGSGSLAGLFAGITPGAMIPITTQAAGGIVVGLVTKYAGGVRKGFGLVMGILITGLVQNFVQGAQVSHAQLVATPMVILSLFLHSQYPPKKAKEEGAPPAVATPAKTTPRPAHRPASGLRRRTRRD